MFNWLRRLFSPPAPWRRSFMALEDRQEGLEARLEKFRSDLAELRGWVYAQRRGNRKPQEAPEGENSDEPGVEERPRLVRPAAGHQARTVPATDHLSRRFRTGG